MKIRTGYSYYGQDIGILVNASQAPRVPGDAGHAQTFAYPVRYQITGTSFMDLVEGSAETREKILSASRALKDAGVRGIVADCGLMSLYQQDVAREVGIPFVGSSLCQIPFVWQLIGRCGTIGIITGHSEFLRETPSAPSRAGRTAFRCPSRVWNAAPIFLRSSFRAAWTWTRKKCAATFWLPPKG